MSQPRQMRIVTGILVGEFIVVVMWLVAAGGGGADSTLSPKPSRITKTIELSSPSLTYLFGEDRVERSKKLELVHITKNAGDALEQAAAKSRIIWGACHYREIPRLGCTSSPDWEAPRSRLDYNFPWDGFQFSGEPWHTPPQWLRRNPYVGSSTFVVVQNPYHRIIAEYYCSSWGPTSQSDWPHDAVTFNTWIQQNLTGTTTYHGHMLPQWFYVWDMRGNLLVNHVLRYENLAEEFPKLMDLYGLPMSLLVTNPEYMGQQQGRRMLLLEEEKRGNLRSGSGWHMTIANMTAETIGLINRFYRKDFESFGYPMIDVGQLTQ